MRVIWLLWMCLAIGCQGGAEPASQNLRPVQLDHERHGHCVEPLGEGLLLFGGIGKATGGRGTNETFWLGPGDEQWQPRANMNQGRTFASSLVYNGSVYSIGGGIERYDADEDRWVTVLAPGSLPRTHFAAAASGSTLFVLGGFPVQSHLLIVDLEAATVEQAEPPPGYRPGDHFHFLAVVDGRLHVLGGLTGYDADNEEPLEEQGDHWVRDGEAWQARADAPAFVYAKFAVEAVRDDTLYLFGDFGGFAYDASRDTWSERGDLPRVVCMPGAVLGEEALWVVGGWAVEAPKARLLMRYDFGRDAWTDQSRMPTR